MTFGSAKEMLDTILQGTDLYSPSNALYVFVYNDEGTSICTYSSIEKSFVDEYMQDDERDEYLGAYLGMSGSAICDDEECLEYCEEFYTINDWVKINEGGAKMKYDVWRSIS